MLSPIDITTDETSALMRRLQGLEARADDLEANSQSVFNYFRGTTPQVEAFIVSHEKDPNGTTYMVLHEYGEEFEGLIQGEIFVKFQEGVVTV